MIATVASDAECTRRAAGKERKEGGKWLPLHLWD